MIDAEIIKEIFELWFDMTLSEHKKMNEKELLFTAFKDAYEAGMRSNENYTEGKKAGFREIVETSKTFACEKCDIAINDLFSED